MQGLTIKVKRFGDFVKISNIFFKLIILDVWLKTINFKKLSGALLIPHGRLVGKSWCAYKFDHATVADNFGSTGIYSVLHSRH